QVFSSERAAFFFSSRRRHTRSKRDWSSDVCSSDLVAFIKQGEIVGTHDLRTESGGEIRVVVSAQKLPAETVAGLTRWCTSIRKEDDLLTFSTNSKEVLPEVHRYLAASGADIFSFTPERLSLEELFLKIMGEDRGL